MAAELYDRSVRDLLVAAIPPPEVSAYEDWADVLGRSTSGLPATTLRGNGRPRRVWLVAAVVALVLLVVGASLAAVGRVPWWQSADPPVNPKTLDWQLASPKDGSYGPPAADRNKARTVARIEDAALVAAPVGKGGYCLIPSMAGSPDLGVSCLYQPGDSFRSYARPASQGTPRWIVYGRITDPHAAQLDLSEAAGEPLTVPLRPGGFFLAALPEDAWSRLNGQAGPGRIVDASGTTLRTGCVDWGPSPEARGAGARFLFWHDGAGECRPSAIPRDPSSIHVDLSRATNLVDFTLRSDFALYAKGTVLAIWRAPASGGLVCEYMEAVPQPKQPRGGGIPGGGGGSCGLSSEERPPDDPPLRVSVSVAPAGVITGEVAPSAGIVRLGFRSASGEEPLAFAHDHFIGQLPDGDGHAGTLPPGGPFFIVGYDAEGHVVIRLDVEEVVRQASGGGPRPARRR